MKIELDTKSLKDNGYFAHIECQILLSLQPWKPNNSYKNYWKFVKFYGTFCDSPLAEDEDKLKLIKSISILLCFFGSFQLSLKEQIYFKQM